MFTHKKCTCHGGRSHTNVCVSVCVWNVTCHGVCVCVDTCKERALDPPLFETGSIATPFRVMSEAGHHLSASRLLYKVGTERARVGQSYAAKLSFL